MHLLRRNGSPCNNRVEDALDKRSVEETPVRSSPDFLPWITLLLHREFSNLTRVSGYAYLRSVVSGAFFLDSEKKKKNRGNSLVHSLTSVSCSTTFRLEATRRRRRRCTWMIGRALLRWERFMERRDGGWIGSRSLRGENMMGKTVGRRIS